MGFNVAIPSLLPARLRCAAFPADAVPGVGPLGEIARRPWGERSFYATDPFGNPLCFVGRDSVFRGRA